MRVPKLRLAYSTDDNVFDVILQSLETFNQIRIDQTDSDDALRFNFYQKNIALKLYQELKAKYYSNKWTGNGHINLYRYEVDVIYDGLLAVDGLDDLQQISMRDLIETIQHANNAFDTSHPWTCKNDLFTNQQSK